MKEISRKHEILTPLDQKYPERLRRLADPPSCLYLMGKLPDDAQPTAAIIGARDASSYGLDMARAISSMLASRGVAIISGLARGVDAAAHWGAIDVCAPSCAVMGCSLNRCYPAEHYALRDEILRFQGCILSEYPEDTPPYKSNFIQRNRLIAALADIVIVTEAKERSGTSSTVEYALDMGKEVFALPGRMLDPLSTGCNRLIRDGAHIVCRLEDIMEYYQYKEEKQEHPTQKAEIILDKTQKILYSCLDFNAVHLDRLSMDTGVPVHQAMAALTELELMGLVECSATGYYRRRIKI